MVAELKRYEMLALTMYGITVRANLLQRAHYCRVAFLAGLSSLESAGGNDGAYVMRTHSPSRSQVLSRATSVCPTVCCNLDLESTCACPC